MRKAVGFLLVLACIGGCKSDLSQASSGTLDKADTTNSVNRSASVASTSTTSNYSKQQYSGFLKDNYSKMKPGKAASGEPVMRWVSPNLTRGAYDQIMMEPTILYPAPQPSKKVPQTTLSDILHYFDGGLWRQLYTVMPVIKNPTPERLASKAERTLKLRVAITAVNVKSGSLEGDDMIALGLSSFSDKAQPVTLYAEYEVIDAATGEVMAVGMRQGFGKTLKHKTDTIKLNDVKPVLETWISDAGAFFKMLR